jgi:ABC-type uncharacterized transport system substrate-binding protein
MPRIGILMPGLPSGTSLQPFYRGLHQPDYVVGKNVAIEVRYANSNAQQLSVLATELADLKVDISVAWSTPAALAAKQATGTILLLQH